MLEHIKKLVSGSEKDGYALPAFNIHGLESVIGVAQAAAKAKSPIIIQVSEGTIEYLGLGVIYEMVSRVADGVARDIPIALHIDHGRSEESVYACIDMGFSSVHIDGSHLSLEENIALTKKVVKYAHAKNVWVQGEVGAIVGGHGAVSGNIDGIQIAKLDEVIKFVEETGVDTIAAAVGTAHGVYDNEDILIDLLVEIKKATKIPFVLHGGSGVKEEKIKMAIANGVNIINIGSDIKIAFSRALIKNCEENQQETDPRKLLAPTIAAIEETAIGQIKLFGSDNRI